MLRVLVVEDIRAMRMALVLILKAHGYTPVEAETAEDALEAAALHPPDLMLVDHSLPGRSGADLVRAIRQNECEWLRSVPIVGLSGARGSEQPLLEAGASCFVPKPIRSEQILKAVRWAVDVYQPGP